jgi:hypothetical protein
MMIIKTLDRKTFRRLDNAGIAVLDGGSPSAATPLFPANLLWCGKHGI